MKILTYTSEVDLKASASKSHIIIIRIKENLQLLSRLIICQTFVFTNPEKKLQILGHQVLKKTVNTVVALGITNVLLA